MKKKTLMSMLALAALLVLAVGLALAQEPQPQGIAAEPPDSLNGTNVAISYTECSTPPSAADPADCITSARAQLLADQLDDAWNAYVTYGFTAPYDGGNPRLAVWVFSPLDQGARGWSRGSRIEIDPFCCVQATAASIRAGTPHHELFHQTQINYNGDDSEPGWVIDGTAKMIEDNVFNDTDGNAASQYTLRSNVYLGNPNRTLSDPATGAPAAGGLLDISYNACLFWKYLTEQFGNTADAYFGAEPQFGVDWLVDFWDAAQTQNGISAVNTALPAGVSFEDAFAGFLVTNYLKRLAVVNDYRYADDPGPAYIYDPVLVEYGTENLPLSHNGERVEDWGANYYVGHPVGACPFIQVTLDGDPGDQASYAVFAVSGANAFFHDHPGFRTVANDFTKTIYNDGYGTVVAVVGGLHNPAEYSISMDCVAPELNIIEPRQDLYAEVGDPDQPRRMMVYAEVTGTGGTSFVEGLSWEDFEVSVGGTPVDDIVTGAYVQSQYWLIVQPPTQTVTGDPPWEFDLDVTLETLTDHEDDAVHYRPLPHYDEVLVIDVSGSMNSPVAYPKLRAAKNAAKLYVDELADDDKIGAVKFQATADPLWNGMITVDNANRQTARNLIEALGAGGCTSIGDGLMEALDQYSDATLPGSGDNPDVIILLSDGMENTPPCWEHGTEVCNSQSCSSGPYVRDDVMDADVIVHTIALGTGSHEDLMERIADDTDGQYRFATLPSSLAASAVLDLPAAPELEPPLGTPPLEVPQANEWAYRLSGIYDFFEGEVEGRERMLVEEVSFSSPYPDHWEETPIFLDQTVSHATFAIAYEQFSVYHGGDGDLRRLVELQAPNKVLHFPTFSDGYHDVFEIDSPMPGTWTLRVQIYQTTGPYLGVNGAAESGVPAALPYNYQVMIGGQTGLAVEVQVGTPHEDRFIGLCVPIFATFLGTSGPLQSGVLEAIVTTPTGGRIPISLLDNGNQGDGAAGDGIYGGRFCRNSGPGSYTVDIGGRWETMVGTILRRATTSFYVQDDGDEDGDGLPNHWEEVNGLDPAVADDTANPDLDLMCFGPCAGFTNANELNYGTDPNNDDSDGGGEMDFSELLHGQDPAGGPDDDGVDIPTSFRATPGTGENIITYDARPQDDDYWLFWSTDPGMEGYLDAGHRLSIGTTGVYSHTGLTNGTPYYYLLVALRDGHLSGFADQASATPSLDPIPPEGNVLINDGAERAASLDVTLRLWADEDATDMLIANTPDFAGAVWEPLAASRPWRIVTQPSGVAVVYARFRDAAGNVGEPVMDGIFGPRVVYLPLVLRANP